MQISFHLGAVDKLMRLTLVDHFVLPVGLLASVFSSYHVASSNLQFLPPALDNFDDDVTHVGLIHTTMALSETFLYVKKHPLSSETFLYVTRRNYIYNIGLNGRSQLELV